MAMTFYYAPGSCSMSSHIALEEVGAQYEPRAIKLAQQEQRSPEYLALNPRGRVPVLVLDDGRVLTECAAILLYLAGKYPKAKLWPDDAEAQAQCIEWLSWLASGVHVAFAQTRRPPRFVGQNPDAFPFVKTAGMNYLRSAYVDIERRLSKSAYAVAIRFRSPICTFMCSSSGAAAQAFLRLRPRPPSCSGARKWRRAPPCSAWLR